MKQCLRGLVRCQPLGWGLVLTTVAASACRGGPVSVAPQGLRPAERAVVARWVAAFTPDRPRLYEIRPWRFQNERGSAAGRAAVRIVPPDSLRFDYRGPFGRSGAAVVIGDSALWVEPEEEFGGLVALAPLFWGSIGLPPHPPPGAPLYALERRNFRAWRYIVADDTLNWVLRGTPATELVGELRREGRTIGITEVDLNPLTGLATASRIDFPLDVSRFSFTVNAVDTLATLDPTIWHHP